MDWGHANTHQKEEDLCTADVKLNEAPMTFILDTGAGGNGLDEPTWERVCQNEKLERYGANLMSFSNNRMEPMGSNWCWKQDLSLIYWTLL